MVKGDGRTGAALGAAAASVGSAASAALAALCCAGPATVALLGVGGAVAAAGLKPYRPLLLLGSLAVLGLGFWLSYRGVSGPGRACPTRLGRVTRVILWTAAGVWVASAVLPG